MSSKSAESLEWWSCDTEDCNDAENFFFNLNLEILLYYYYFFFFNLNLNLN